MTPKRLLMLDFIRAYFDRHHMMPTIEEMRVGLGHSSKSTIFRALDLLCRDGYLTRTTDGSRNLKLLVKPDIANSGLLFSVPTAALKSELARRAGQP